MPALEINWTELNQRHLTAALAEVRACLERHAEGASQSGNHPTAENGTTHSSSMDADPAEPLPAMEMLVHIFGLSSFERATLVLCAGIELDSSFAGLCAAAQGNPARAYPTFSLALAALPQPHWSALSPAAPLRRRRLIEVANQPGVPLTTSPLRIDERILHFLTGLQHLDERLAGLLHPVPPADELAPSHAALARTIASTWRRSGLPFPAFHLCGADEISKRAVAAAACAEIGLQLYALAADHIPNDALEVEGLMRLWERESVLSASALYIDTEAVDANDARGVAHVGRLLERLQGPVILSTTDRWRPLRRGLKQLDVVKPTAKEQLRTWQELLGDATVQLNGRVPQLAAQFNLHLPAIRSAVEQAMDSGEQGEVLAQALWDAGRAQARARLDDLAQRIEPVARWDDLVLPSNEKAILREISSHVRHRSTVYESWGFAAVSHRGLGISALFAGSSGTGKTMAAEVLANTLHLDLYRIDLSSVVSKYIGETEKNLRRVFDAAEDGGAILFFDEADALFGKRTEVKDSHDRYANIEINYLLQRMECYRGLAVLATNMRSGMDAAFLRRLRFVTNFPFPEFAQRAEIWERVFPQGTPVEGLNIPLLARLSIAGGNIRNIAVNAAFRAAEDGSAVRMTHLAHAARSEFLKMDKPVPETEIAEWV